MRASDRIAETIHKFQGKPKAEQIKMAGEFGSYVTDLAKEPHKWLGLMENVDQTAAPISAVDRALIKNLDTNAHDSISYLEKHYPNLEFTYDDKHDIYARPKGAKEESPWQPMDPRGMPDLTTGAGLKEAVQNVGDVAGDTVAGAASGVAGTIGTMAGGLPAGMALGGLTSGVLETLRQGLGKKLGINKSMDVGKIGMQTGIGAVSPLVFSGVGNNPLTKKLASTELLDQMKQAIANSTGVAMKEIDTWAPEQILGQASKLMKYGGIGSKVLSAGGDVFKGATSMLTGTKPSTIEHVAEQGLSTLVSNPQDTKPLAEAVTATVQQSVKDRRKEAGTAMNQALSTQPIKIGTVLDRIKELIGEAKDVRDSAVKGTTDRAQKKLVVDRLKDLRDTVEGSQTAGIMTPKEYNSVNKTLAPLIDFTNGGKAVPKPGKRPVVEAVGKYASVIKDELNTAAETGNTALAEARGQYNQASKQGGLAAELVTGKNPYDIRKVEATVGGQGPDMKQVSQWAQDMMTPEEYTKFLKDTKNLGANLDYQYAKDTFTPMGSSGVIGAKGALAAKATPAKALFQVLTPTYGAGQTAANAIRTLAPAGAQIATTDAVTKPGGATMSPEEQAYLQQAERYPDLMNLLKQLGSK